MSKIKANRRRKVRAQKRARQVDSIPRVPSFGIAWMCDDPSCLEGIHQLSSRVPETRPHNVEGPSPASESPSAIRPIFTIGGATGAHATEP